MRLAVVGGGIAGLAAAWEARHGAEVTVFDPGPLGGKLRTADFDGRPVDAGPDAWLTRVPAAGTLAAEVGLDDLVAPAAGRALLWTGGRLSPLPPELVLGVPRRIAPLLRTRLLNPLGVARAGLDLVLPRTDWPADVSVHDLVARRFGHQVATRLVDPLIGSIHAGRTEELSAAATVPQLLGAARSRRSLMLALRGPGTPAGSAGPIFLAPRAGMGALPDRLVAALGDAGVRFVAAGVTSLRPGPDGLVVGYPPTPGTADPGAGAATFDAVVVATPAAVAAAVLGPAAPDGLAAIPTASVTMVTMEYRADALDVPAGASGLLVPRAEGRLMTACSFASAKWPHWAVPGRVLLRVSAGRDGDRRPDDLDDGALTDRLAAELSEALGARGSPLVSRVTRWPGAFPQYRVGHLTTVARIEAELAAALPGVHLAGASYHGAGVPACIASGRSAAAAALAGVTV